MNRTSRYLACIVLLSICRFASSAEVCASIGQHVISFDQKFLAFSPTLKGVNYWAGQDPARKKAVTCHDQVVDVTIYYNWPQMTPAASELFSGSPAPERVSVSIKPLDAAPSDMGYLRDFYTLSAKKVQKDGARYDTELHLNGYRGNHGVADGLYSYYWADNLQGNPWFFMMCTPLPDGALYKCEGQYFLDQAQSLIVLSFPASLIKKWKAIIDDSNKLIVGRLKN